MLCVKTYQSRSEFYQMPTGSLIGKGSFSIVSKELLGSSWVAKKHARDPHSKDHDLLREYSILSSLHHPNIIQVIDLTPLRHGFYMSLYEIDLHQVVVYQLLSLQDALSIIRQAATGLAYLHQQGYGHFDLKPANILLRNANTEVAICDFGFSAKLTAPSLVEEFIRTQSSKGPRGTLLWLAPERLIYPHVAVSKSDIYSLGLVCYSVLAGEEPWNNYEDSEEFAPDLRADRLIGQLTQPARCSPELWQFLQSCWQYNFRLRPNAYRFIEACNQPLSSAELPFLTLTSESEEEGSESL